MRRRGGCSWERRVFEILKSGDEGALIGETSSHAGAQCSLARRIDHQATLPLCISLAPFQAHLSCRRQALRVRRATMCEVQPLCRTGVPQEMHATVVLIDAGLRNFNFWSASLAEC